MIFDPISWSDFSFRLREWAEMKRYDLAVSDLTSSLFQERILPTHACRKGIARKSCHSQIYSFFESVSLIHRHAQGNHPSLSPISNKLLVKINKFDRTLLMLGILPNQLRSLAKEHQMENRGFTDFTE